jgi:DNA-directed RNA polymerase sigma subunit (sigma70/sigma32)
MIKRVYGNLERVMDRAEVEPVVSAMRSDFRAAVMQALAIGFRSEAKRIMSLRFALGTKDDDTLTHSLEDIARVLRITSHRVRAVEAISLAKLRNRLALKDIL